MRLNRQFHKTVRFWLVAVFWSAVAGGAMALPAFAGILPPLWFLAICVVVTVALTLAKLAHRPGT